MNKKDKKQEKERKELFKLRLFAGLVIVLAVAALYVCNKAREPKEIVYKVFRED